MIEVPIKASFESDAEILGRVTWFEPPTLPSYYTLAVGYTINPVTSKEQVLMYAYIPDSTYKRNE